MAVVIDKLSSSEKSTIAEMIKHYKTVNPLCESLLRNGVSLKDQVMYDPFSNLRPYMSLIKNEFTQEIALAKEFWYSPEAFSNALYGTYDLGTMLLYINDMASGHEFKRDTVKAIATNKIPDLIKILVKVQKQTKLIQAQGTRNLVDLTIHKL